MTLNKASIQKGKGTDRKIIQRKNIYPITLKNILLVDDVLTTGATLHRSCELLKPSAVFVIAAHSLWIKENKPYEQVEKSIHFGKIRPKGDSYESKAFKESR